MADTGSQWSDLTVTEGPSLATTAPTESVKSSDTATPLRKAIEKGIEIRNEGKINLDTKIKLPIGPDDDQKSKKSLRDALRSRAQSRAETFSLPETSQVKPDHAEELLNEAVLMDRTLDEIQGLALKRPKDLLLGKLAVWHLKNNVFLTRNVNNMFQAHIFHHLPQYFAHHSGEPEFFHWQLHKKNCIL